MNAHRRSCKSWYTLTSNSRGYFNPSFQKHLATNTSSRRFSGCAIKTNRAWVATSGKVTVTFSVDLAGIKNCRILESRVLCEFGSFQKSIRHSPRMNASEYKAATNPCLEWFVTLSITEASPDTSFVMRSMTSVIGLSSGPSASSDTQTNAIIAPKRTTGPRIHHWNFFIRSSPYRFTLHASRSISGPPRLGV
jgi:hypothetical protein